MTKARKLARRSLLAMPALLAWLLLATGSCQDLVITSHTPPSEPEPDAGPECTIDGDCDLGEICSLSTCAPGCREGDDRCPPGETCIGGQCHEIPDGGSDADADAADSGPPDCPDDMVVVAKAFCMDRFEASRPDATDAEQGSDNSKATSRDNVLPWFPVTKATAQGACAAAGKRLCTAAEFQTTCGGSSDTVYAYGNTYDPLICNSIDTYCYCGGVCGGISPCPYPHCYNQPPSGETQPESGCKSSFHVMPTKSFQDCVSEDGVWDLNGNVWELVDDGSDSGQFRGGAYNCMDSELLHRCDYVAIFISAKGFRCCK